jgi:hypothetical protein
MSDHEQYALSESEYQAVLTWVSVFFLGFMKVPMWSQQRAMDELDPTKASGVYWRQHFGPLKSDVLQVFSFTDLLWFFESESPCFSSILKDEIRLSNKMARLFLPAPIEVCAVGNWLFGAQNEALTNSVGSHPCTIGVSTPGAQICSLYASLVDKSRGEASLYDADVSQWDIHFQLWQARLCRDLRMRALEQQPHLQHLVRRYYSAVYAGWVCVLGNIVRVINQKSGQTNTAHDNSIANFAIVCLHAIRLGWTIEEFRERVLVYVNGDDIVYWTNSQEFSSFNLCRTYNSVGHFLDTDGRPKTITEITYLGAVPTFRSVGRRTFLLPCYRVDKLIASSRYLFGKASLDDELCKLCALCLLVFADSVSFAKFCSEVDKYITDNIQKGVVYNTSVLTTCLLILRDPEYVLSIFLSYEGRKVCPILSFLRECEPTTGLDSSSCCYDADAINQVVTVIRATPDKNVASPTWRRVF